MPNLKKAKILDTNYVPTSTSDLQRVLLNQYFASIYRKQYDDTCNGLQCWVDIGLKYVSIHPYGDLNGRTSRFLSQLARFAANETVFSFLSDLDLITDVSTYELFVKESSNLYKNLIRACFIEMLRLHRLEKKAEAPDYYKLPEWNKLITSLDALGISSSKLSAFKGFSQPQLELVRTRNWAVLFDQLNGGPAWKPKPSSSFNWQNE